LIGDARGKARYAQEDRQHIPLDPYPLRLLIDPDANLIRAVGAPKMKATGPASLPRLLNYIF
jgi:hypothetical protein